MKIKKMFFAIGILCIFGFIQVNNAQACNARECSTEEIALSCGENLSGPFRCKFDASTGCAPLCTCPNESTHTFIYDSGCACNSGTYGIFGCSPCPSSGSDPIESDVEIDTTISNCYKQITQYNPAVNGTTIDKCYYDTFTSSYSLCFFNPPIDSCNPGYYRVNYSDTFCTAVGTEYYSRPPYNRAKCPTYLNPSGSPVPGQTDGLGLGADAITDCKIPHSDSWSNTVGYYGYANCHYSN